MSSPVIIHIDSGVLQAGLAGDAAPRVEFEPLVSGRNPIGQNDVTNWSDWTALVKRAFTERGVPSQGAAVMFTEAPLSSKICRETLTRTAFDTLGVSRRSPSLRRPPCGAR